jgi:glycosyltransferase involved in cell wall biosynthesis
MVNNNSQERPLRLAILQRVCPGYRIALFSALSSDSRIDAKLFIGDDIPGSKVKNATNLEGINYEKYKTKFVKLRERILPWHEGLILDLRKFNPDVILCEGESHFLGYIQAIIYKYLFNNCVALVHWCFISLPGWSKVGGEGYRSVIKRYFRRFFDAFLVYSSYSEQCLLKLGQPPEKIFIGTNVGDVEKFFNLSDSLIDSPQEARYRLGLPERFTVLYVGSLESVKRPHIMLDLVKMCDNEKYNFVLLGSGMLLKQIRDRVINENLANVFVPGRVREELPLYYRAADVLLIPGRGGIVISEAMAFGLPVIVHQADGTEYDLVQNGTTGIHLSTGDHNDFRNALEFLLNNQSLCTKMGLMSRQIIESRFKTNDLVEQIVNTAYFARDHQNNLKRSRGYIDVIKSKAKWCLKLLRGYGHLKPSVFVKKQWYGNNYGGFFICPEFLNSNSIVYSFGIGEDISFDQAVIYSHNC